MSEPKTALSWPFCGSGVRVDDAAGNRQDAARCGRLRLRKARSGRSVNLAVGGHVSLLFARRLEPLALLTSAGQAPIRQPSQDAQTSPRRVAEAGPIDHHHPLSSSRSVAAASGAAVRPSPKIAAATPKVSPLAGSVHSVRAVFFAMATVARPGGLRSSSDRIQACLRPSSVPARRVADVAPMTSSRQR